MLRSVKGLARDESGNKLCKYKKQKLGDVQVSCEKDVLHTTQFELVTNKGMREHTAPVIT